MYTNRGFGTTLIPRRNPWIIWRPPYPLPQSTASVPPAARRYQHSPLDANAYAYRYNQADQGAEYAQTSHFDPFTTGTPGPSTSHNLDIQQGSNNYSQDPSGYGPTYLSGLNSHSQLLQYHHYAPLEPSREPTKPNQKLAKDLFIPEDIRQRLHDKSEAFLRVFPNSTLPTIEFFHTLTPLQGASQPNQARYGHTNTVYKAVSERDGKTYCLRRIHDLRVTTDTEHALRSVRSLWSRVKSGSVVSVHFAFTTPKFGDSSVIYVSDYHPASETLAEKFFTKPYPRPGRSLEDAMWSFIVQIANALKAIHSANLAARIIDRTKIIVTDENRIRLNGCAVQDLLDSNTHEIRDLQRQDLQKCGKVIVDLAQNLAAHYGTKVKGSETIRRNYSERLIQLFNWFTDHSHPDNHAPIDLLLTKLSTDTIDVFDASLKTDDVLQATLNRELENSRVVRLMTKLDCLNERPEYEHDRAWSNQGPRTILPLFRDYVFHQVDAQGNPVVDMGHILACLNKLDVGVEEKILLTTRDEQSTIVVSFKELKQTVESAWTDLIRRTAA